MISLLEIINPFEAFQYSFFLRALLVVALLSLVLPIIGVRLSSKGFSMVADTLSHTSLAGIAIGLVAGSMPLIYSIIFSIVASLLIELIRRKFPRQSEIALAIILSFSLGLTGILSKFAPASKFESYLFGSLFTVNMNEVYILIGLTAFVILYEVMFYRSNLAIAFNEEECKANGMNVILLSTIDTIITSVMIALASNIVGSLLVTSFISIPVAVSLKTSKSSLTCNIISAVSSLIAGFLGLFISFSFSLHVGGTIVMVNIFILLVVLLVKGISYKRKRKKI